MLLLLLQAAAMEFALIPLVVKALELSAGRTALLLGNEIFWSGLIALAVAIGLAVWIAGRITVRLERVLAFAQKMKAGDLDARLELAGDDALSTPEAALNQAAEQIGLRFRELESRRQELAAMLDSMQEAVVAITPEGMVRWSNATMQRVAGTPIHAGRPLVHSVRDPEVLACVKAAQEQRGVRYGRASSLAPGRVFEINAAPLPSGGGAGRAARRDAD